jgi:hypothetical protein
MQDKPEKRRVVNTTMKCIDGNRLSDEWSFKCTLRETNPVRY